ncbi:MAG: putative esterase [Arcticibacterium sp.]|jgi:predicted esterase
MNYQKIKVERTARYIVLGEITSRTKNIWMCFHGYGQLASFFAKKFEPFIDEETCFIIPEGISRFYIHGKYERVGASWLTRDMKEEEAAESLAFINNVYASVVAHIDLKYVKLHAFGFSQGCAMACRWLNQLDQKAQTFIIWAGFFAKGISDIIEISKLKSTKMFYVYGSKDEFLISNPEIKDQMLRDLKGHLETEIISFDGEHRVEIPVLREIMKKVT